LQSCQFHIQQNAQKYVTTIKRKSEVAEDIRGVFNAPNRVEDDRYLEKVVNKYVDDMPKLAEWMDENIKEKT